MAAIKEMKEIPLKDLVIGKGQVRLRDVKKDVTELADSIRKVGLLEPIVVCPADKPGKYEIITGQRRFLAHQELKKETIFAVVLDEKVDETTAKVLSLTENLIRPDLNRKDLIDICTALGSPERKREYTQEEVEERFLKLVLSRVMRGPVYIKAHRGTIQRALQILSGQVDCPLLASARLREEVEVYRNHGYTIDDLCLVDSEVGRTHIRTGKFIRFYGKGDGEPPIQMSRGSTIALSAYMARRDDPVMEYSDCSFGVALSNHADFNGTLEYIKATNAKYVVTDNARGGHGVELALEITKRLGIPARPSTTTYSREWGLS